MKGASGAVQSRRWPLALGAQGVMHHPRMGTAHRNGHVWHTGPTGRLFRRRVVVSGHPAEGLAQFGGPGLLIALVGFRDDTPAAELLLVSPEENLPGAAAGDHLALDQGLGQHPDQRPVGGKQLRGGGLDLREIEAGELGKVVGLPLVRDHGLQQYLRRWLAGTGASQGVPFPRNDACAGESLTQQELDHYVAGFVNQARRVELPVELRESLPYLHRLASESSAPILLGLRHRRSE